MSFSVTPVLTNQVQNPAFKSERKTRLVSISRWEDYEVRTYETEASTGKKWGVGIASAFVSGLGQAINGEWGKGAAFFLGSLFPAMISSFAITTGKFGTSAIAGLTALGVNIYSIVDAVKNAKSETTQIFPINAQQNTQQINTIV